MKLLILGILIIFGISDATYASTENLTASNQQQSKEDKTKKTDTVNSTKPFNPSKSFELLKPQFNLPLEEIGLFGWEGMYGFSEIVPVNSTSNLIRNYEIRIYKQDSGYAADITMSGSQTPTRITAQVKATSNDSIGLYFSSSRDSTQGTYQPGSLLLQLQKLPQDRFKVVFAGVSSLSQNRSEFVPENMVSTKMIRAF
jgi:hypothetical protein